MGNAYLSSYMVWNFSLWCLALYWPVWAIFNYESNNVLHGRWQIQTISIIDTLPFVVLWFETGSHYVAYSDLELSL